ncbi:hypothetical protein CSIM01_01534 [Colletotrichum simmondsii]|uniref:Uncharacterized protein n=1 Tax=Colletotrichum simmondsii TaxID=703756 RepID=A0A135TRD7_9PEZI|nr:hypothetical protein CSIM01_01534 [Colletotrichum simmondsii]
MRIPSGCRKSKTSRTITIPSLSAIGVPHWRLSFPARTRLMWQLNLVNSVIAAFVTLSREANFAPLGHDGLALARDAQRCYTYLSIIRRAVYIFVVLREPAVDVHVDIVNKLLIALESRLWAEDREPWLSKNYTLTYSELPSLERLKAFAASLDQESDTKRSWSTSRNIATTRWKVTNVHVGTQDGLSPEHIHTARWLDQKDICQRLAESADFQLNLAVDENELWELGQILTEDDDHYTDMKSLYDVLGSDTTAFALGRKDQLSIFLILSNSLLNFHSSPWAQSVWSSDKIYFRSMEGGPENRPVLAFPYLSVNIHTVQDSSSSAWHEGVRKLYTIPKLVALGMIFIEILTRKRFPDGLMVHIRDGGKSYESCISAIWKTFKDNRNIMSPAMTKAISACIKLEMPYNFPGNDLRNEELFGIYIKTFVMDPLIEELQASHGVTWDSFFRSLTPGPNSPLSSRNHGIPRQYVTENTGPKQGNHCILAGAIAEKTPFSSAKYRQKSCQRKVKVAVLDSGLALSQMERKSFRCTAYRSFVDKDQDREEDDVGHGTHVATLLRRIAPDAQIFVARIYQDEPTHDESANAITNAIKWAIDDCSVDIIVMSFGFNETVQIIADQIRRAVFQKVLIFAAASNDGKNRTDRIAWPAREEGVVCIHSGDGMGNPSRFTPAPEEDMRIMVLGERRRMAKTAQY